MSERERVRRAIEGPVEEAVRLVDGSPGADVETRLSMLINGWGRGLAAGLEELAIAVGDLRHQAQEAEPELAAARQRPPAQSAQPEQQEPERDEDRSADEEELRERAVRSRQETAELREEASSEPE
jgi:hypothetical protein